MMRGLHVGGIQTNGKEYWFDENSHVFHEVPLRYMTNKVKSLVCKIMLRSASGSDLFMNLFFVVLTGQVREEAEFTVTFLRLFFFGQHFSERLECSDVRHLFLSEVFPLKM
jgi:hypothetical protein